MSKLPKFMVASNPLVDPDKKFILHTRSPEVLISVQLWDHLTKKQNDDIRTRYPNGTLNMVPNTRYVLIVERFYTEVNTEKEKENLAGVMKRAGDWWYAYLKKAAMFDSTTMDLSDFVTWKIKGEGEKRDILENKKIKELTEKYGFKMEDVNRFKKEWKIRGEQVIQAIKMANEKNMTMGELSKFLEPFTNKEKKPVRSTKKSMAAFLKLKEGNI